MDRSTATPVAIHQVLHGYSGGHRMLAASRKLPREVERPMLLLSDLSGSGAIDGFDGYLTGYPLPAIDGYALARTWYARELPRPGCVWTHTLILPVSALCQEEGVGVFLALFRRPSSGHDLAYYETALAPDESATNDGTPAPDRMLARGVASALYAGLEPCVLAATTSGETETLLLALWEQQWTSLRSVFSFCTGSLALRSLDGRPFDVQVVPRSEARRLLKSKESAAVDTVAPRPVEGDWLEPATRDISSPHGTEFRRFLHSLGQVLPGERTYFRPLSEAYRLGQEARGAKLVRELLAVITRHFPGPTEGMPLKTAILEAKAPPPLCYDSFDLICEVVKAPGDAYLEFVPAVGSRAQELWDVAPERLYDALARAAEAPSQPLSSAFVTGVLDRFTPEHLPRVMSPNARTVQALATRKPGLLTSPLAWKGGTSVDESLVAVCEQQPELFRPFARGIVTAVLTGGASPTAERLAESLGEEAIAAALDWLSDHARDIPADWGRVFAAHLPGVLKWAESKGRLSPHILVRLVEMLRGARVDPRSADAHFWLQQLEVSESLNAEDRDEVLAFLLALGFERPSHSTFPVAAGSFDAVYRLARGGAFSDRAWGKISYLFPSGGWLFEWDRCRRLRQAAVERFLEGHWESSRLPQLTSEEGAFSDLVQAFNDESREARRLIRRLHDEVESGRVAASDWQRRMLARV